MSKHLGKAPQIKSWLIAALLIPAPFIASSVSYANEAPLTQSNDAPRAQNQNTQEFGYIRDDLFVYMHAGSSTKFKIIGSINAATPVEKLDSNSETNYIQVKDDKGRIGWIEDKSYTTDTPVAVLFTQANQQNEQLAAKNLEMEAQISQLRLKLNETEQTKNKVASMLELATTERNQLQAQVTENTDKHQLKQMMFGAGIIVVGLILGLILPHLIPRKRRGDQWM